MTICAFKRGERGVNGIVFAKKLEECSYTAVLVCDSDLLRDKDGNPVIERGFTHGAVADRIRRFREHGYDVSISKDGWKSAYNS